MSEKITTWMKVTATNRIDDEKNYLKVKKVLNEVPEVRDQSFDEKTNTITIKVICSDLQKVIYKLLKKPKVITRVEPIAPPQSEAPKSKRAEKGKQAENPKEPEKPKQTETGQCSQPRPRMEAPVMGPQPIPMMHAPMTGPQPTPTMQTPMMGPPMSYGSSYHQPPVQQYEYPSRPVYDSYAGNGIPPQPNHPYYGNSAFDQFSDENPQGCIIM